VAACPTCGEQNPDGARFCLSCGSAIAAERKPADQGGGRRTVTILFADLEGSTDIGDQLDPEALSRLMDRYFDMVSRIVSRHGGTIEKYIGDAVMAVFGVPRLHEDDALRAVRAASEIVEAVKSSNEPSGPSATRLEVRVGLNTGEVVANAPDVPGQRLVTGDAVNVASRLQEVARGGEVVLGRATYELVRDRVKVGPVEEIQLRGKRSPVAAYRLERLGPEVPFVRSTASLIGRDRELKRIREVFESAVAESRCELFTIIGPAGVGKSRLAWELERQLRAHATFVRGRCLSYGQGITYWPIAEIVRSAVGIAASDPQDAARRELDAFLSDVPDGHDIATRVAQLIGLDAGTVPREELYWSVRRLLEVRAAEQPVVAIVDDIHWAEPSLLDLLDYLVETTSRVPLLLLCMTRPDLLEHRPGWGGGKRNATSLVLDPLGADRTAELLLALAGSALPPDVLSRISDAAEGNPLYIEETFRMLVDGGSLQQEAHGWVAVGPLRASAVPSTIQALLAARLDQLEPPERVLVQTAAIVGRSFGRTELAALLPEGGSDFTAELRTLTKKELLRPEHELGPNADRYRFRHDLIRDAAYASLPKLDRAILHERYARWLETAWADRLSEFDAIISHHLDQAFRYRTELGQGDPETGVLRQSTGQWLARAGRAASDRRDLAAASELLSRAIELLDHDDPEWAGALIEYGDVVGSRGDYTRAGALLEEAVAITAGGEPSAARKARLYRLYWQSQYQGAPDPVASDVEKLIDEAIAAGDDKMTTQALVFLALAVFQQKGRVADARTTLMAAREYAQRSGDPDVMTELLVDVVGLGVRDETPCDQVQRDCQRLLETPGLSMGVRARAIEYLGVLTAMQGEFDEARGAIHEAQRIDRELGDERNARYRGLPLGLIEQFAGNPSGAEAAFRDAYDSAREIGDSEAPFLAARLALPLHLLGRDDEALVLVDESAAEDLLWTRILAGGVQARILARQGRDDQAIDRSQAVLRAARDGGFEALPNIFGAVLENAAAVMRDTRHPDDARLLLDDAISRYEAKGNIAAARLARDSLAEIEATPA
jgi:class 3 adenylate cyclase/tetratricopeptide (TPR) repeat protein